MDLRTHYPYSLLRYGLIRSYPSLDKNTKTEVAIIGCGITGALIASELHSKGFSCIVVDKRHVATGSTAASTSLVQYEIDVPLYKLQEMIGREKATRAYHLCRDAIDGLKQICEKTGNKRLFESKCSLQYASYKKDIAALKLECKARKEQGFNVEILSEQDVHNDYHLNAPAALLVHEAAQLDAYLLTHGILQNLPAGSVYDHTEIIRKESNKRGHTITTMDGFTIQCKFLVIACGYESGNYLGKNIWEEIRCTYALVSEPMHSDQFWKNNCLIWETADPYLYIRTCDENRILIGGKDTAYYPVEKQIKMLPQKTRALKASFEKRFPGQSIKVDFSWAGAFATTKDGLPFIGQPRDFPRTYFALGYGGNGISFSYIAAKQIVAAINGDKTSDNGLFSFDRL